MSEKDLTLIQLWYLKALKEVILKTLYLLDFFKAFLNAIFKADSRNQNTFISKIICFWTKKSAHNRIRVKNNNIIVVELRIFYLKGILGINI